MVGVWGIGGSGKTTLASSVYTQISRHFHGHCIVSNIREASSKDGLETLQQKILSTVLKTRVEVQSVQEGKHILKSRLCNSKVLVVLDDVNDLHQLQALAGSHKSFGDGSRIIITTRDEHVLTAHRVDHISPVKLLSDEEAILLLYKHAYNEKNPLKDYKTLSLRVFAYAAGLPLALKVLGSFLYDKDEKEWMSALAKLKDFPNIRIINILRISYDGLETLQKELFLDIACFFRWKSVDEAMKILDASGFHPVIGIKVLRQKALITISDGKFDMHDLVQETGHYIVRGEHPNNLEKHSRVWKDAEVDNMCQRDATKENENIEAMQYSFCVFEITNNYYDTSKDHSFRFYKFISNLKKLRLLIVHYNLFHDDEFAEGPYFLSNELRYFYWRWYPVSPFPESCQPTNLVVLKLENSLQKELWKGCKHLPYLKVLELSYMKNLLSAPDFDGLPCLQKLKLGCCNKLEEIHPSLGNRRSIEYVSVSRCPKLRKFPTIVHMEKLKTLKIMYCYSILDLPEIIQVSLKNLEKLNHRKFLSVFHRSTHILMLNLSSLRKLDLRGWGFKDGEIPSDLGDLSNLEQLDLSLSSFSRLDFSLSRLTQLKFLNMSGCKQLVELPELPSNIAILKADYCDSLATIGDCHRNCKWLHNVSIVGGSNVIDGSKLLRSMLQLMAIQNHSMILRLQGQEIPKKFLPSLVRGNTRTLQLPENWHNDFCRFLICAVSASKLMPSDNIDITMKQVLSGRIGMDSQYDEPWEESNGDYATLVGYVSFLSLKQTSWWDGSYREISFSFDDYPCRGFGFRLVHKRSETVATETSTQSPDSFYYTPTFGVQIVHD